jgi:hypothetical protein
VKLKNSVTQNMITYIFSKHRAKTENYDNSGKYFSNGQVRTTLPWSYFNVAKTSSVITICCLEPKNTLEYLRGIIGFCKSNSLYFWFRAKALIIFWLRSFHYLNPLKFLAPDSAIEASIIFKYHIKDNQKFKISRSYITRITQRRYICKNTAWRVVKKSRDFSISN